MKRCIALLLTFMLCLSLLPIDSLADEDIPDEEILLNEDITATDETLIDEQVSDSEDTEKVFLTEEAEVQEDAELYTEDLPPTDEIKSEIPPTGELLVEDEPMSSLAVDAVKDTGDCGDSLTWTLYESGLLVITGTGEMTASPWSTYSDEIKTVTIENGVTNICYKAFGYYGNLTNVTIPDSVTSIDGWAFICCSALTDVIIPTSGQ